MCIKLIEDAHQTGEAFQVFKYGKLFATVVPARSGSDYLPGTLKDSVRIVGDIIVDGKDLGIEWEAMK